MQRILIASCCFSLLVVSAATSHAQNAEWREGGRFLYVSGGTTSQVVADTGASLRLGAGYGIEYDITRRFSEMFAAQFTVGATAQKLTAVGDDICCGGVDGDELWLFPVTVLGQFHIPIYSSWDPYVGIGAAWTIPYYKVSKDLRDVGVDDIDFKGSFGFAAQAGVNYSLNNHWFANLDVRYLGVSLEAEVRLDDGTSDTVDYDKVDLDIKPWVIGFGFGYRF